MAIFELTVVFLQGAKAFKSKDELQVCNCILEFHCLLLVTDILLFPRHALFVM